MDKFLVRKDVYEDIMKAIRDRSHLTKKQITDKNGHRKTVYVNSESDVAEEKGKKPAEASEEKTAKPKFKVGDRISLEGQKGLFYVKKVDADGSYHVEDTSGTKGYHVSENHIEGKSKVGVQNMEMTSGIKKISDAINELYSKAKNEKDAAKKKTYMEQARDIQTNGLKSDYFKKKPESNVSKEEVQMKDYSKMSKDELLKEYNSTKDMDERDKIMAAYENADKKTDSESKKDNRNWAQKMADEEDERFYESEKNAQNKNESNDKKTEYRNQLDEIKKNNPSEYMRFMTQANKDYQQYLDAKSRAEIVDRSPMFSSFPGYATAKKEVAKWEEKYPDFKETSEKNMAIYR